MISLEEGLKSVLIVNLSRIGLSPGLVRPPPLSDQYEFCPAHLCHLSSLRLRTPRVLLALICSRGLTIASWRSALQCTRVSLLAPRSWNLITASLANLELIHFRWRWLITADEKSHPGRTSTLPAVNKKGLNLTVCSHSREQWIYRKWLPWNLKCICETTIWHVGETFFFLLRETLIGRSMLLSAQYARSVCKVTASG